MSKKPASASLEYNHDTIHVRFSAQHCELFKSFVLTRDPNYIKNYALAFTSPELTMLDQIGFISLLGATFFRKDFVKSEKYRRAKSIDNLSLSYDHYTVPDCKETSNGKNDLIDAIKDLFKDNDKTDIMHTAIDNFRNYYMIIPCQIELYDGIYRFKRGTDANSYYDNPPVFKIKGLSNMLNYMLRKSREDLFSSEYDRKKFLPFRYGSGMYVFGEEPTNSYAYMNSSVFISPKKLFINGKEYSRQDEDDNFCEFCKYYLENSEEFIMNGVSCNRKSFGEVYARSSCYKNFQFLPELFEDDDD